MLMSAWYRAVFSTHKSDRMKVLFVYDLVDHDNEM